MTHFDGSLMAALSAPVGEVLAHVPRPSGAAAAILGVWLAVQALLLGILPGRREPGPVTPAGNRPIYKLNGVPAFLVTLALWFLVTGPLGLFSATIVYDHFGELLVTSSIAALLLCAALYLKGRFAPSSSDASTTGNFLWDFYWGTELHPRIGGLELKQLINCRFAMMGWAIIILSHAAAQHEQFGQLSYGMVVSLALQLAYIFKFFVWEGGYFNSIDIMHDRFGFYIAWGVCAWLPIVYTLATLDLAERPDSLGWPVAFAILLLGMTALAINYAADEQRQRVRATNGATRVWGRAPELIVATYVPADGKPRQNLLLASGWWGVARHFHYLPELTLAFAWTLPIGFDLGLPWFYVIFLTILLVHRSLRDDDRCARKYGPAWETYRARVRWRILPGVF